MAHSEIEPARILETFPNPDGRPTFVIEEWDSPRDVIATMRYLSPAGSDSLWVNALIRRGLENRRKPAYKSVADHQLAPLSVLDGEKTLEDFDKAMTILYGEHYTLDMKLEILAGMIGGGLLKDTIVLGRDTEFVGATDESIADEMALLPYQLGE